MLALELTLYTFNLNYARSLASDIPESRFVEQPTPGGNTPLWIFGHLTISTDYALMLLGQPMATPKEWHRLFGPGSSPVPTGPVPTKTELLATYEAGHARVAAAVPGATPEALSQPHTVEMDVLKRLLPTKGQLLAHLLTTHEAMHLGQLSAWRRQIGLKSVL
jgi:hypothetical protein